MPRRDKSQENGRPERHRAARGPVAYWHVDDIDERLELLLTAGVEVQQTVRDVGAAS
jgi:hypothetical protein